MQLNIIRKDSAPSGQEELHTESVTVTVKEGAEEPVAAKPGIHTPVRPRFLENWRILTLLTSFLTPLTNKVEVKLVQRCINVY